MFHQPLHSLPDPCGAEPTLHLSMFSEDDDFASTILHSTPQSQSDLSIAVPQRVAVPLDIQSHEWLGNGPEPPPPPPMPMLGMLSGTLIPCMQGIIGSIFYLRLAVIVGTSGVGLVLAYLFVAISCTLITSASMGAILSNITQAGGGTYSLLSRTLGNEIGGSIGLLYWLSLVSSAATNALGFCEVLRGHVLPEHVHFTSPRNTDRLVGVLVVTAVFIITTIPSPPTVHRFAAGIGFLTLIALLLMLGSLASASRLSDSLPHVVNAVPTLSFSFGTHFHDPNLDGARSHATSWVQQFSLLFPMVTGMMAGAGKSGLISHPSRTIPKGTLIAIILSTAIYIVAVFLLGAMIRPEALRTPQLHVLSLVTWPHPFVGYLTTMVATLGLTIQSTLGARGILRAMARDRLLSLDRLYLQSRWSPALVVLLVTAALVSIGGLNAIAPITTNSFLITYAVLNAATALGGYVCAPWWRPTWPLYNWIVSAFGAMLCLVLMFLISWWVALITFAVSVIVYRLIELHGAQGNWGAVGWWSLALQIAQRNLQHLELVPLSAPGYWRPQIIAFLPPQDRPISHPHIAALVRQLKKTGGLSIICQCLLGDLDEVVESGHMDKVNQDVRTMLDEVGVESFVKVTVSQSRLDGMVSLLQGAGLGALKPNTVLLPFMKPVRPSTVSELTDSANVSPRGSVRSHSSCHSDTLTQGESIVDTQVIEVPWDAASATELVKMIRSVRTLDKALLLVKGVGEWPIAVQQTGTIDVYWLVLDGGILCLLPWLLQRHHVWNQCKLRVFAFGHASDDLAAMRQNLKKGLDLLRIKAEANIIEMGHDVSEFAHEHTRSVRASQAPADQWGTHAMPSPGSDELRRRNQTQSLMPTGLAALSIQSPHLVRNQVLSKRRCDLMNTAQHVNAVIREHSLNMHNGLVVSNLPVPMPHLSPLDYVQYLETLSEGVPRMIFVKGNGLEVV